MNKRVTLKEIVGTKIIYTIILAVYYWMWSRSDWKDYYQTIQGTLGVVVIGFFIFQLFRIKKYKSEGIDEMAEHNLKRCDSICLKLFLGAMIVTAWAGGVLGHIDAITTTQMGWIIIISIFLMSVIRTVLFAIMDSKGV
ncbi:MAG: hypothetical protein BGO41_14880 [Clostridiales bacterium 38-18]|nr:MAG: hypothetical protein BGO41_14880 [Clostridiales bacterium 38-18]